MTTLITFQKSVSHFVKCLTAYFILKVLPIAANVGFCFESVTWCCCRTVTCGGKLTLKAAFNSFDWWFYTCSVLAMYGSLHIHLHSGPILLQMAAEWLDFGVVHFYRQQFSHSSSRKSVFKKSCLSQWDSDFKKHPENSGVEHLSG